MTSKAGWYKGSRTMWHWYDNDSHVSICGTTVTPMYDRVKPQYSRFEPDDTRHKKYDGVCYHCRRMLGR